MSTATWIGGIHAVQSLLDNDPTALLELMVAREARNPRLDELMVEARNVGIAVQRAPRATLDRDGSVCDYALNRSLVSLTLDEFSQIPMKIGVAAGPNKAGPILSVMRGRHLDTLVTDEATASRVIDMAAAEGGR